ncbi:MAG: response regulator transcription factor [Candidatus Methylomirabilales bacterium]
MRYTWGGRSQSQWHGGERKEGKKWKNWSGACTPYSVEAGLGVQLTASERKVLRLITEGQTNRDIGHRLGYSMGTVKDYVQKDHPETADLRPNPSRRQSHPPRAPRLTSHHITVHSPSSHNFPVTWLLALAPRLHVQSCEFKQLALLVPFQLDKWFDRLTTPRKIEGPHLKPALVARAVIECSEKDGTNRHK